MNSNRILLLCLVFLSLPIACVVLNDATSAQDTVTTVPSEWEYKVANAPQSLLNVESGESQGQYSERFKETLEVFLNDHGRGGWELVSYSDMSAIYKREASN